MRHRLAALAVVAAVVAAVAAACRAPPPMLSVVATPPATLPPPGDLVRACAFEVSCFHDPPSAVLADCIGYLRAGISGLPAVFSPPQLDADDYRRWAACGAANDDCAGALDCATRGHGADFCAAHPGTTCDGDLLVPCPPAGSTPAAALFTIDCAARARASPTPPVAADRTRARCACRRARRARPTAATAMSCKAASPAKRWPSTAPPAPATA